MDEAATNFLKGYSVEVTTSDQKSIEAAIKGMSRGSEVFIASLSPDTTHHLIPTAVRLSAAGLVPVPHIVARNIPSFEELDRLLGRLASEGNVNRVLLLAGDRDKPAGPLHSSLQILESGLLQKHGISNIAVAAHPERHPRVSAGEITAARLAKVKLAGLLGMKVTFVTQFCFDAVPIISLAKSLRTEGIRAPLRVGIAGPASRASLLKYALICGVGPSLRALKERRGAARNMMAGETPEDLVKDLAIAQTTTPSLGMSGIHFFTFGSLADTIAWVEEQRRTPVLT